MSKGWSNFRFGNARTTLNGGGGSGEPTTREVVQGVRTAFAGSAADVVRAKNSAANSNASGRWNRRPPTRQSNGISPAPACWEKLSSPKNGE